MHDVVTYHNSMCQQTAIIVTRGHKLMGLLTIESNGIAYRTVPLADERYMRPLMRRDKHYPLKTALNSYIRTASRLGATKSARKAMRELKNRITE